MDGAFEPWQMESRAGWVWLGWVWLGWAGLQLAGVKSHKSGCMGQGQGLLLRTWAGVGHGGAPQALYSNNQGPSALSTTEELPCDGVKSC